MTYNELRAAYAGLTGAPAPMMKHEELQKAYDDAVERREQAARDEAENEAAKERAKAEREARAADRGGWESFSTLPHAQRGELLDEEEKKLAWSAWRMRRKMESAQEAMDKLSAEILKDPVHALSWSKGSFEEAATLAVGKEVKRAVEIGATSAQLLEQAQRETISRARSPESSSSATSNLMDRALLAAWASLVDLIDDRI